jgi:AraC-like DNA-binding protein
MVRTSQVGNRSELRPCKIACFSVVKNTEIRWLVDEATQVYRHSPELGDTDRISYPFPPGMGNGWLETMYLGQGMTLAKAAHIFTPEAHGQWIPLAEFTINYHEPTFAVSSCPKGRMHYKELHPVAELSFGGEQNIVRYTTQTHLLPLMEGSCSHELFAFSIGASVLARLLGEEIADALISGFGLSTVPSVRAVSIPHSISSVLHSSLPAHLNGHLKRLFTQAKLLEYLCVLADYVIQDRPLIDRPSYARDAIRQLHADLLKLEGKLPTLDELDGQYGLPARTLNAAFKEEFGQSIFSFINDYRLNEAHVALMNGSLPLKQLAARLGYSHVNHFIYAFKRKFGYSPGSLRRGKALR